jgi:hypothetical protein
MDIVSSLVKAEEKEPRLVSQEIGLLKYQCHKEPPPPPKLYRKDDEEWCLLGCYAVWLL